MHDNQENISYTVEEIPEDQIKSATDNGIADSVSVPSRSNIVMYGFQFYHKKRDW
jgi:hypothetical protein